LNFPKKIKVNKHILCSSSMWFIREQRTSFTTEETEVSTESPRRETRKTRKDAKYTQKLKNILNLSRFFVFSVKFVSGHVHCLFSSFLFQCVSALSVVRSDLIGTHFPEEPSMFSVVKTSAWTDRHLPKERNKKRARSL